MPRRILEGEVVSNKTDKTVTVLVERKYMHPVYKKYIKRTDKYAAHDPANKFQVGERVSIIECRPISKTKRWAVVDGDQPATQAAPVKEKKPAAKKETTKKDTAAKKADEQKPAAKKPAAKKTTAKKKDA